MTKRKDTTNITLPARLVNRIDRMALPIKAKPDELLDLALNALEQQGDFAKEIDRLDCVGYCQKSIIKKQHQQIKELRDAINRLSVVSQVEYSIEYDKDSLKEWQAKQNADLKNATPGRTAYFPGAVPTKTE